MNMLRPLILSGICLLLPLRAGAQIRMELKLQHSVYLQYEPVMAALSINNDSDKPIVVHASETNANAIRLEVRRQRDRPVERINDKPIVAELSLAPGSTKDIMVDLSQWYDLVAMGRYAVRGVVEHEGQTYETEDTAIDVVRGIDLANVSRRVTGAVTKIRAFSLRYWPREGKEYLFLCVTEEPGGLSYGVFPLGQVVRVFPPTIEVNREGTVQVVLQANKEYFSRCVFKSEPAGVTFVDQSFQARTVTPFHRGGEGSFPEKPAPKKGKTE
jgi:hypothetical protein